LAAFAGRRRGDGAMLAILSEPAAAKTAILEPIGYSMTDE